MTSYKFARRSFLRGAGAAAPLLLPLLRSIEARAAGAAAPLRLLIIQHPGGTNPGLTNWVPGATGTTTTFTLPYESAPFAPLQKYMVMVDGLNLICVGGGTATYSGQNTSECGMVTLMTGVPTIGTVGQQDHCAGGASIDQLLLQRSPLLGGPTSASPTPFGSLALAADIRSSRDEIAPRVLSYLAPKTGVTDPAMARQPIFPETSPLNEYKRVFGAALPAQSASSPGLNKDLSALNYMKRDLARMRSLIPASEKGKLDVYADAIAQLEASLRAKYGTSGGTCVVPSTPPSFPNTTTGKQGTGTSYTDLGGVDYYVPGQPTSHPHADLGQTQLRLIKAAFACDVTRVATFMWASGTSWVVFPGTFQGATIQGNLTSAPHYPVAQSGDSATQAWLNQIDQFYSAATSAVLQEFATTPDIDGNMLIDNTVIVYVTEVARAFDHNQQNMPLIVFGGKNTRVNGGTFLKVSDGPLPTQTGGTGNRPFNDLWLALAPVFGVTMSSLGDKTQYTGPLPGVFRAG
ncbi:MAG TPA: DUF1552 domain-containing protein [Polyangia bacterium]|nr:DUF1552 domain-containing protein [Polyangia bacterium]